MAYMTGTYFAPASRGGRTTTGRNLKLVGYWLSASNCVVKTSTPEIKCRLDDHCSNRGYQLNAVEWDCGSGANPIRVGLWRAMRRLSCDRCQPKQMAMTFLDLDDFVIQALSPCTCGSSTGLDGIILTTIKHLSSDPQKSTQLILRLAEAGKHVFADDGICLSCCHPATKKMLQKKRLLPAS